MAPYQDKVAGMMRDIEAEVKYTRTLIGRNHFSTQVMAAMRDVPRHEFVPENMRPFAYDNGPLPIGDGQTISQPYIVALMTDLLDLEPNGVVLEVGTGSGYQAAILARLVKQVYSIEIVEALRATASERLKRLGYGNVEVCEGDGYHGLPEHAPYDAIIVTAAAPYIPPPLIEQLKPGGRMVIPVGSPYMGQDLQLVTKSKDGSHRTDSILAVAFVPLTGDGQAGRAEGH